MTAKSKEVGRIEPITDGQPRPFWSVMIPTYNCAKYLRQTLASVLAQDPGPEAMQIEVVDDCSTRDDPEAVVQELGPGRVRFYRQPANLGHTGNFLTCLRRSRGHAVHMLHGDDYVLPGFYAKMQRALEDNAALGAAFCRHHYVDENDRRRATSALELSEAGIWPDAARKLAFTNLIQTPSIVVRRAVYEQLGGFHPRLSWTEDWEMWVRVAVHYPIWFEPETLAAYRMHGTSNTSRYTTSGENIRDLQRCVDTFRDYFPVNDQPQLVTAARQEIARFAIETACRLFDRGENRPAFVQLWEGLKCSPGAGTFRRVNSVLVEQLKRSLGRLRRKYHLPGRS